MASGEMKSVLQDCARKLNHNTTHLENFLSLQDDVAADFTSLTKTLYDLQKAHEPDNCRGSPLVELAVENFDEEQIWQELELQNDPVLQHFELFVENVVLDETLTVLGEGEEEKGEDETVDGDRASDDDDDFDDEEEEVEWETEKSQKKKTVNVADKYSDEDSDLDFDVDALEKREKLKKKTDEKLTKTKGIPSEVDDKFFKLSDMESFLDDMDKREGKANEDDDVDYFQDFPSDGDEELDLEQMISKNKKMINVKSSRNLKYNDYFDPVEGETVKADESEPEDEDGEEYDEDQSEVEEEETE